jgi:hypothetical protein
LWRESIYAYPKREEKLVFRISLTLGIKMKKRVKQRRIPRKGGGMGIITEKI